MMRCVEDLPQKNEGSEGRQNERARQGKRREPFHSTKRSKKLKTPCGYGGGKSGRGGQKRRTAGDLIIHSGGKKN